MGAMLVIVVILLSVSIYALRMAQKDLQEAQKHINNILLKMKERNL